MLHTLVPQSGGESEARARGEESEENYATGQTTPPPAAAGTVYFKLDDGEVPATGVRPPPLALVRPQGTLERHTGVGYELIIAYGPWLGAIQAAEPVDERNDRATLRLLRGLAAPPVPPPGKRRKRKKRRREKAPEDLLLSIFDVLDGHRFGEEIDRCTQQWRSLVDAA